MTQVMFDVDGTLVQSYDFDEACFIAAVKDVTGLAVDNDWESYPHVTDKGILATFIDRQAPAYRLGELERAVKAAFTKRISKYLASNPAREVTGAIRFFEALKSRENTQLSIATGGWRETAMAKLMSAGFDLSGIPLASSNDHHSRTEIMQIAGARARVGSRLSVTYFGDAEWDVRACKNLGVNLVIVGAKVAHHQTIHDFSYFDEAMQFIELADS